MTKYLGDLTEDQTIDFTFNTHVSGTPTTLGGTPALSVYKTNSTTETTTGPTLTVDFDSRTGLNHVRLVTTDAFYVAGADYRVVITTGTVGGNSVVGVVVAEFSIQNRNIRANVVQVNGEDAETEVSDIIRTGTCQAGSTSTTLVLDAGASATDNIHRGCRVRIISGTGAGQDARIAESYAQLTQTLTVKPSWVVTPDDTSVFVLEAGSVNVETLQRKASNATGLSDLATYYISNGFVPSNMTFINGTSIAGTTTQVAAAFLAQYDVATPVFTNESVNLTSTVAGRIDAAISTRATPTNITAASGVVLASNGLDSISITRPSTIAANFREMLVLLYYRFFGKVTKSATEIKNFAANGTDVVTTQTISTSGDDETQGAAS